MSRPVGPGAEAKRGGIYYGWVVVGAAFAVVMTMGEAFYSFGAFFKPLEADFGWSRATTSSAYTTFLLGYALSAFFMGRLGDKYGPRPVISVGGLLTGGGLMLAGLAENIWQLRGFLLLSGVGAGAGWSVPTSVVQRWFIHRRGLVLGITATGAGLGALVFVPLANYLITAYGWRNAYLILGALYLVMMVAAAWAMVHSPEKKGLKPYGAELAAQQAALSSQPVREMATEQAVRTRAFYGLVVVVTVSAIPIHIALVHLIPMATDAGIAAATAAAAVGLIGGISIPGRVLGGAACDRIGWNRGMGLATMGMGLAVLYLFGVSSPVMLYSFVIVYGFFQGIRSPAQVGLMGHFFGTRALGELIGLFQGLAQLVGALGPYLAGYIYDVTGSYNYVFLLSALLWVSSGLLALALRPPALPH